MCNTLYCQFCIYFYTRHIASYYCLRHIPILMAVYEKKATKDAV
jgi:hypothetical protein